MKERVQLRGNDGDDEDSSPTEKQQKIDKDIIAEFASFPEENIAIEKRGLDCQDVKIFFH